MTTTVRAYSDDKGRSEYELLRHAFTAAQASSMADKYWQLHSFFTEDTHVMTEYVAKDGSMLRADSTGERGKNGRLEHHEFTFYPSPPIADETENK